METDALVQCANNAQSQGAEVAAFNSLQNAADIKDLWDALGFDQINLYGVSYGTRLAMSLMHFFPEDAPLRSVILDSVDTLPEDVGTELSPPYHLMMQTMFEDVFAACQADADCAANYPDLRVQFDALVQQLNQQPIQLIETPPGWSEHAASILPNVQLAHIPNTAHSILGNNSPCPTDIASQFLAAPGQPVDASCTDEMGVEFLLPEE